LLLLVHMFFENLLLVLAGMLLTFLAWGPLFEVVAPQLRGIGLESAGELALPFADLAIILLAGLVGVVLAMMPIAFGLRKPTGLILQ
jgi:hypothetical protein